MSDAPTKPTGPGNSDALLQALQQCSERLDRPDNQHSSGFPADRTNSLTNDERLQVLRFQEECLKLRQSLVDLPMAAVGVDFARSIMRGVHQQAPETVSQNRIKPASTLTFVSKDREYPLRGIVATVSVLLVAATILFVTRPQTPERQLSQADIVVESQSATESLGLIAAAEPQTADQGKVAGGEDISAAESLEKVRTSVLADGPDWQILVVRLASQDKTEVMNMLAAAADSANMKIQTTPHGLQRDVDSFGVLLTSTPSKSQSFVDSVAHASFVSSSEWNPSAVGRLNREELIAAVRSSMLSPTESEMHFGEVYLAIPQASAEDIAGTGSSEQMSPSMLTPTESLHSESVAAGLARAENMAAPRVQGPLASSGNSGTPNRLESAGDMASVYDSARITQDRPILVVFEFQRAGDPPAPPL